MANGADTSAQTAATNALGALPFGNIIGGPLVAAVEAQATAARSTVEFIEAVGFKTVGDERKVNTVTFKYQNGPNEVELVVPILTIVPIPFIRIDDMTIQFKANISAESSTSNVQKSEQDVSATASVEVEYWAVKADFKASYSSKKDSTSSANSKYAVEYTMDVYVHAVQDDIPAGLNKVLNLLTESIERLPTSAGGDSDAGADTDADTDADTN